MIFLCSDPYVKITLFKGVAQQGEYKTVTIKKVCPPNIIFPCDYFSVCVIECYNVIQFIRPLKLLIMICKGWPYYFMNVCHFVVAKFCDLWECCSYYQTKINVLWALFAPKVGCIHLSPTDDHHLLGKDTIPIVNS